MEPIYDGLSEEQRDAAQAYAAEHRLAFETYPAGDDTVRFTVRLLPGDEGAPQWTGAHIDAVEALLRA